MQAVAANTPLGDLDCVWQAWLAGVPVASPPSGVGGWGARTRAVAQAITQSLTPESRRHTGLILATTKGNIDEQVRWMRAADSHPADVGDAQRLGATVAAPPVPTLAAEAGRIADAFNLQGPTYAVSTACTSGITAIIDAAITLLADEASHMIAFAADEITDFVGDGFRSLHALSRTRCRPFDLHRDGLTLGSAAAACLLAPLPQENPSEKERALAVIAGWGISNDAFHMTAPDPAAGGLIRAIRRALAKARLVPDQIDVILAHGTATKYNDAMEAVAIEKIFLTPNSQGPAITAAKGLIGHTLGAAGLIEANLAVKILQHQVIPSIVGLENPDNARLDFVTSPRTKSVRHILKIASGFGGMNAAIILSAAGARP